MESRKVNIMFQKAGSGSISTRVSLPKSWIDEMKINQEEREAIITFDGERIEVKKMKKYYGVIETSETGFCDKKYEVFETPEEAMEQAAKLVERARLTTREKKTHWISIDVFSDENAEDFIDGYDTVHYE